MRKFFNTLLAVIAMVAVNAQDVKNQFVKWASVPAEVTNKTVTAEKAASWLKAAMNGKDIPGADVRTTAATYKAVWGEQGFNFVNTQTEFFVNPAKGTEINFALDSANNPVQAGKLKPGTLCIAINTPNGKVNVAKIGTNGCINALLQPAKDVADAPDPDVQRDLVTTPPASVTTPGNTFNIGTASNSNNCCGEWVKGFDAGFDKRSLALYQDFSVFKEVVELRTQPAMQMQPQMQTGWVMSGQPMMMQASVPAQQVVVQQPKNGFWNSLGNGLGQGIGFGFGNRIADGVINIFSGRNQYAQGQYCAHGNQIGFCQICNGGFQNFGPGFQWNNGGGGGYTDYSGGPIHPASGDRFSSGIASSSQLIPGAGSGYGYNNNFGPGFLYR